MTRWILGLLIFDLTTCHELHQFPQNCKSFVLFPIFYFIFETNTILWCLCFLFFFQVEVLGGLRGENSVTLTCNTETEGHITWKFHDGSEEVISGDNVRLEGLNLTILDVDEGGDIGEYSCWRGQEKLSSVYLLLEANEEDLSGEINIHTVTSRITETCAV